MGMCCIRVIQHFCTIFPRLSGDYSIKDQFSQWRHLYTKILRTSPLTACLCFAEMWVSLQRGRGSVITHVQAASAVYSVSAKINRNYFKQLFIFDKVVTVLSKLEWHVGLTSHPALSTLSWPLYQLMCSWYGGVIWLPSWRFFFYYHLKYGLPFLFCGSEWQHWPIICSACWAFQDLYLNWWAGYVQQYLILHELSPTYLRC